MVPPRSPPAMISTCSSIVAMTGNSVSGSNSLDEAPGEAGHVARVLDDHALQAEAQPERRDAVLAGEVQRAELALDAAHAETAGHADAVEVGEVLLGALGGAALVGRDPADRDLGVVGEAAGAQRLGDREVRVGQVDVLADEADRDLVLGLVHDVEQFAPARPVDVGGLGVEAERVDEVGVEALVVQHRRDVVDARHVDRVDHGGLVDVAHERDLALVASVTGRSLRSTSASGWMPIERSAATECWVGLVFCSPEAPMNGTSDTCTKNTFLRPSSWRTWRADSMNGCDSMSPTVPPISVMITSGFGVSDACSRMRRLISSVMCGMTCTVSPRYSPRRSLAMTVE